MLIRVKKNYKKDQITTAFDIYVVLRDILLSKHKFDQQKEHFWCVILARNREIKFIDEVSIGNLNYTIATPREVFRFAILKGADCIIVGHNHPSGSLKPSNKDKEIMKQLTEAGEIIGIPVLDSLIITERSYYSFNGVNAMEQ